MVGMDRLTADLHALCEFGRNEAGGWTRPAYSQVDQDAHLWLASRMEQAGLATRFDGAGNLIGRLEAQPGGTQDGALVIGSHIDTVPRGGWLDGALGVLAGLEVARRLLESRAKRTRPFEVIAFRDEEGRFGPFTGSRAMTGKLDLTLLPTMRDVDGLYLSQALTGSSLSTTTFATAAIPVGAISAYLELHIEQGPVLEAAGKRIGVVSAIVGQARFSLQFQGRPDHAGTTPMNLRRDAFAAAADFASHWRKMIMVEGKGVAVGTVGVVRVEPNAGNVVPSKVTLGAELRDIDDLRLNRLTELTGDLARHSAQDLGVEVSLRVTHRTQPALMNGSFQAAILGCAIRRAYASMTLASGAGHDAQNFADLVPAAMIFVPSIGGRSHCPEEATDAADLDAGLNILLDVAAGYLST